MAQLNKALLSLLFFAFAGQTAWAQTAGCDFSSGLCDFALLENDPDPSTSLVSGGRLVFHTNGQVYNDPSEPPNPFNVFPTANEVYAHQSFMPAYNRSWQVEVTASIPAGLEAVLPDVPAGEDYRMEGELAVVFTRADGSFSLLSNGLLIFGQESGITRQYESRHSFHPAASGKVEHDYSEFGSGDESGLLGLRFDAASKALTAYTGQRDLLTLDLDQPGDSDWQMTDGDRFMIAIGFEARGWAIDEFAPVALDNFVATAVPEPGTYAMMLIGLGLLGFVVRRRAG